MELVVDVLEVGAHGLIADMEFIGDAPVAVAVGNIFEDL